MSMSVTVSKVWVFFSSSDPDKTYETLQMSNRKLSCSCPGWTRRVAPDGTRSCRHVRLVHLGLADEECERFLDYATSESKLPFIPKPQTTTKGKQDGKKTKGNSDGPGFGEFGGRNIIK